MNLLFKIGRKKDGVDLVRKRKKGKIRATGNAPVLIKSEILFGFCD